MSELKPKYKIGDVVYLARPKEKTFQHDCPGCLNTKEWKAVSPAGNEYSFGCPRCSGSYKAYGETELQYSRYVPAAERLTIGSVRTDSAAPESERISYMCLETGVGSGSVYYEPLMYGTEKEALAHSKELAEAQNEESPHIFKHFDQTLVLSDYKIHEVAAEHYKRESDYIEARGDQQTSGRG